MNATAQPAPAPAPVVKIARVPWSAAAVDVSSFSTMQEKLDAAGLNFKVEKRKAFYQKTPETPDIYDEVPNQFHIVRTDKGDVISAKTVSDMYKVLQNVDAYNWIDNAAVIGEISIVRGGVFENGAIVYMLGKYHKASTLPDGSVIEHYVLFSNGHGGNKNLVARPVNFCPSNGAVLSPGASLSKVEKGIRHTKNMTVSMAEGVSVIQDFKDLSASFVGTANKMFNTPLSRQNAEATFKAVFSDPADIDTEKSKAQSQNRLDKLMELFTAAGGANKWHAYIAACEYVTYERSTRVRATSSSATSANGGAEKRLESVWYGSGSKELEKLFLAFA